jgi:hypothetical protein
MCGFYLAITYPNTGLVQFINGNRTGERPNQSTNLTVTIRITFLLVPVIHNQDVNAFYLDCI